MNNDLLFERVQVRSLREVDALVGSRITYEKPLTRWEDSRTEIFFASIEEALDSLHDPHFSQFVNDAPGSSAVITEIKEYRRYTRDLDAAWAIAQSLNAPVQRAIGDRSYGLRDFTVSDPDGFLIRFAAMIRPSP